MKKLIIINGPMGVGKTSVGKFLCEKIIKSAYINADWCLYINPFVMNEETVKIYFDNVIYLAKSYIKCSECDYIILSSCLDNEKYNLIVKELDTKIDIHHIMLMCNEETLTERWKNDTEAGWRDDEGLKWSINSFNAFKNKTNYSLLIETNKKNINEVVEEIMNKII